MLPDLRSTIGDHRLSTVPILIADSTTIRLIKGIIPMIQYGVDTRRNRKIDLSIASDIRLDDPMMIFIAEIHHGRDIRIEGSIMT